MATVPKSDLPDVAVETVEPKISKTVPKDDLPITGEGGAAFGVYPKQRSTPSSEETKRVTSGDRLKRIAETSMMGIPTGLATYAAAPALAAGASALFPEAAIPAAVIAGGIRAAGPVASAVGGFLSGLGEESAGQYAQAKEYPGYAEGLLRFAGGGITPELKNIVGYGIKSLVSAFGGPSKATFNEIQKALLKDINIEEKNLSPTQRQYIESVFNQIRGGAPSPKAAETFYSTLEAGAYDIVEKYSTQAKALENQANELINAAKLSAETRNVQAQKRVDQLSSQFEKSTKDLQYTAQQRANNIEKAAKEKAAQIRAYAEKESPSIRALHQMDAEQTLERGRQEAAQILRDSQQRIAELRQRAGRAAKTTEARTAEAAKTLTAVGAPQTRTQTGNAIRESVNPIFEYLKKVRSDNAEKLKGDAFSFAATKEAKGIMPQDTEAFKKGMAELNKLIDKTSLADIKSPLIRIRDALDPVKQVEGVIVGKPATFESLEQIRRFLRDRSFGVPAEGFDAINQIQAGKLADMVEGIQKEFSPSIATFLENYKADSQPLIAFKNKLGQAVVGKEEFDAGRFATDPAELGDLFFKSETGVKDLMQLLGKDFVSVIGADTKNAEQIARGYVASKLQGATAKEIESFLKNEKNRDWLGQFPALRQQLETAATTMSRAERFGGARTQVGQRYRTEAEKLQEGIPTSTTKVLSQAEKDAAALRDFGITKQQAFEKGQFDLARQIEEAGENEAAKIVGATREVVEPSAKTVEQQKQRLLSEAQAAGKTEVSAAEKEAGKLTTEAAGLTAQADKIKKEILGKAFSQERAQQVIVSGNPDLWAQVGPIIKQNPEAREAVKTAVRQVLADIGPGAPRNTLFVFEKRIVPAMRASGLMSEVELGILQAELNKVKMITDPTQQQARMSRIARMTINAVGGEVSRGLGYITDPFNAYRK